MNLTPILILLSLPTFAQTCLTAVEVRKVNDLLDSYEILQEDSLFAVQWQGAYMECERIKAELRKQREDEKKHRKIAEDRTEALETDNGKLQKKVKRTGILFWVIVGIAAAELGYIGIDAAVSK